MLSSKHFIFQLYLTPPSFMMFSSSSRVGMKLYVSIFQCLRFCWWSSRRTDAGRTVWPHAPGGVEIQPPILSSKHFIFQLYLTPPSFRMFSSSSRVRMKLYISIFRCLSFCWWSSRMTDEGRTVWIGSKYTHRFWPFRWYPLEELESSTTMK